MIFFVVRRLLQAIPVVFFLTLVVFIIVVLIPGSPALIVLGPGASQHDLEVITRTMGLDKPLPERYGIWLAHLCVGNWGTSYLNNEPVPTLIRAAFPVTLELTLCAVIVALLISLPGGLAAAIYRDRSLDLGVRAGAMIGTAMPVFISSVVLVYVFAVRLRWLPPSGYVPISQSLADNLLSMVLPGLSLGLFVATPLTRYFRSEAIRVLAEDYVTTARMKGLPILRIYVRHVARNALGPFLTSLGIQLGYMLGGAVIVEKVFFLPGIGLLAVNAIEDRDYQVLQGIVLIVGLAFVLVNILVDFAQYLLTPRLRVGLHAD